MVTCPACGTENADGARFCASCGTLLSAAEGAACVVCGAALPADARFCPQCGTAVERGDESERKLVTTLFADVTGSTALGEQLDPEDLQDVLGAFADSMREEIEAEGGTVEKYIGDAVMAVFGVPFAHEDDAARALRAALRMRRRLARLNAELEERHGVRLEMRVGVNTGEVLAAREARPDRGMVTGDAVNAAARLEQGARPGQILVSERTARSSRGFVFHEVPPLAVKGKREAIAALELRGEETSAQPGQQERGIPGLHAPMVGRDHELDLLRSLYERLAASGRAQLVTVYGDPGIGKSRLANEFLTWTEEHSAPPAVLQGRCLPYGEGVTYWPLAEIVKAETGVLDSDLPETALAKIGRLADDVLAAAPDPARASAALAFTFGLEDARFGFADLPPRQIRLETHEAWRAFFSGLAANGPVIAVVEDIHWAEDALLDLLEELADRIQGPLLFLCPSRPELAQRRTAWGGGKRNFSSLFLEPLSLDESARLVEFLLAVEELPASVRESMLTRAEGNPFFLEEIVRHLIDEGRIVRVDERWTATDDIADIVIPDTVQGVLAARIDLLPDEERHALRSAAVVGRVFWTGPVARLLNGEGDRLDELLSRLEDRELVVSQVGSSVDGEREFVFKHVLTRDVAYGTLSRHDRTSAHAAVAEWIESAAGDRNREFADLLAHHYREAYGGAVADAAAPAEQREELRVKALRALLAASDEARSRMLLEKADSLAGAALSLAQGSFERSLVLEALGLAALWDYRGNDAWTNLSQAVDERVAAGVRDSDELAMLCARTVESPTRWPGSMTHVPSEKEVAPYVEIGLVNARPKGAAHIRLLLAKAFWPFAFKWASLTEEDATAAKAAGEEAAELALELDRPDLASAALDAIGSIDFIRGYHGRNIPVNERRLRIVERLTDPWEIGDALQVAADMSLLVGRYRDALRWADEGFERSRTGPAVWRACLAWRALARFRLGDWDGAHADYVLLEEELPPTAWQEFAYYFVTLRACIALLHELRGERAASESLAALAREEVTYAGNSRKTPWLARLEARRGNADEALAWLERGVDAAKALITGGVLEAKCDMVGDLGLWELAEETIAEARVFAELALLEALPVHADRLEGRAALTRADLALARAALTRARDGFAAAGARWEEAHSALWLAEALRADGATGEARTAAEAALAVFEELRSARELEQVRALLEAL